MLIGDREVLGGPGLTFSRFLEGLSDGDARRLLDASVLSVLDAVFEGRLGGDKLRRVARTIIDLDAVLGDRRERELVVSLMPAEKRAELEARVGRRVDAVGASDWTDAEIRRLREFFGLVEERIVGPWASSTASVTPEYGLFDHQRAAVRTLAAMLAADERRAVLHLPTGVGKTRTAMHVVAATLRGHDPSVVVWLASGKELLEQAVVAFKEAWTYLGTRPLQVGAMWGDRMPELDDFGDGFLAVGLAKGWAVLSRSDPGWAARLSSRVRLVVFDEAHQSVARTYREIVSELTLDFRCALLGLTATPGRTWADIDKDGELAEFFAGNKVTLEVPGENPIEYLVENGFLARPIFRTLLADPGLDVNDGELARLSDVLDIPEAIAATVAHGRLLTSILVARDVRSEVVTGLTPQRVRDRAIRTFKSDAEEPMVLVNYGVLTTGFDAPKASAVVIARPTRSLVLYSQMVGRAIRGPKAGGTDACEIVTVVDPGLPGFGDLAAAFLNWEDVWQ